MSASNSTSSDSVEGASDSDVVVEDAPEKVIDRRMKKHQIQYLLRWKSGKETWENEGKFIREGRSNLIIEYTKNKQMAPPQKVKLDKTMPFDIIEGFVNDGDIYYRVKFPENGIVTDLPSRVVSHYRAKQLIEFLEKTVDFPVFDLFTGSTSEKESDSE